MIEKRAEKISPYFFVCKKRDILVSPKETSWCRFFVCKLSGNGINKYGYSAEEAQIATQMLIWEWQTTRRTSVSASASSYVTKAISGNTLKCNNKILEACRLVGVLNIYIYKAKTIDKTQNVRYNVHIGRWRYAEHKYYKFQKKCVFND